MKNIVQLFLSLVIVVLASRCSDKESKNEMIPDFSEAGAKEQFVIANQRQLQKENDEIAYYIKTHRLPFKTTASGIRYYVYKPSATGDSVKTGMEITLDYTVSLLDGTIAYTSAENGAKTFVVGNGDIESGIHRGVQYLKRGDKALLILPSPLAHGLLGDMNKIPPHMPIVYDINVR
jgi:FKBP-type peptidyl-prolyl cis-trans isomerase